MLENEEVQESTAPETHSEEYLDSLADGVDKPRNSERAMTAAPKEAAPSKEEMFEFVHNGKTIKANKDQLIKYAQQGYDYPQRAQKLNQQTAKWNQERADWEKKWGIYKQIAERDCLVLKVLSFQPNELSARSILKLIIDGPPLAQGPGHIS